MKNLTKGRIKLELVTALSLAPVVIIGLVMLWVQHPRKAQAMPPPTFRILWYPNCSPAWAGGTIWQQGIDVPTPSSGIATGPYCDGPVYIPGFMPQILGKDSSAVLVIDTTTNFCGEGDIQMGFAFTQIAWIPTVWSTVPNSTNWVTMPNGFTEAKWPTAMVNVPGYGSVPILQSADPLAPCPGGVGTGGQ